jgi:hypothetical protein
MWFASQCWEFLLVSGECLKFNAQIIKLIFIEFYKLIILYKMGLVTLDKPFAPSAQLFLFCALIFWCKKMNNITSVLLGQVVVVFPVES